MKALVASLAVVLIAIPLVGFTGQEKEPTKKAEINFEKEIVPIVKAHCLGCHNKDSNKGGVIFPDVMTEADALKNARMWRKSGRAVKSGQMPPKSGLALGDKDREKFLQWVTAKFPKKPGN